MTTPVPEPDPQIAQPDIERWWNTYNAAIAGACGNPVLIHHGFDGVHDFAKRTASRAHGALAVIPNATLVAQSPELQLLLDIARSLHAAYLQHVSDAPAQLVSVIDAFMGPLGNALMPFEGIETEDTP